MNSSIKFYVHKRNFFLILFETRKKCESILLFSYSTWCERHIYISLITCQITLSLTLQCFSISTNIMIFLEIYISWKEHLINIFIGFGCYDQVFNFPNEPKSKKKTRTVFMLPFEILQTVCFLCSHNPCNKYEKVQTLLDKKEVNS